MSIIIIMNIIVIVNIIIVIDIDIFFDFFCFAFCCVCGWIGSDGDEELLVVVTMSVEDVMAAMKVAVVLMVLVRILEERRAEAR